MGNRFNKKHGLSKSRIYRIYNNMKSRCEKPYSKSYDDYGGRGISVCDEWLGEYGFLEFYKWSMENGYSDELSIDRINNNCGYSPDNCRWVNSLIQNNNNRHVRFIEYKGECRSIAEWSRVKNINRATIVKRLRSGWSIDDVLNKPINMNYSRGKKQSGVVNADNRSELLQ